MTSTLNAQHSTLHNQSFNQDPNWDSHNNRIAEKTSRSIRQDFGYDRAIRIGGLITPAWEPAYYAKKLNTRTFNDHLTASGTLTCTGRKFHVLLGFFNSNTLGAWRTPNTFCLRIQGRGDCFCAFLEYADSKWSAGGDSPQGSSGRNPTMRKTMMMRFPLSSKLTWSIDYDPAGNGGTGAITAKIGEATAICNLGSGHKEDGATFNRFGLLNVMKSADKAGEVWLDDVTIDGKSVSIPVPATHQKRGVHFDRFGIVTTVIDGNGQEIYFDDLSYTHSQS